MASSERDLAYRQQLVDELRAESLKIVPLEAEEEYYRQTLTSLGGFETRARQPNSEELTRLRSEISAITDDAVRITNHVNEIYREISRNLNPSTVLYSTIQPTSFVTEHPMALSRVVLVGVLVLFFGAFAAVIGALIHDRINPRREGTTARPDVRPQPKSTGVSVSNA